MCLWTIDTPKGIYLIENVLYNLLQLHHMVTPGARTRTILNAEFGPTHGDFVWNQILLSQITFVKLDFLTDG